MMRSFFPTRFLQVFPRNLQSRLSCSPLDLRWFTFFSLYFRVEQENSVQKNFPRLLKKFFSDWKISAFEWVMYELIFHGQWIYCWDHKLCQKRSLKIIKKSSLKHICKMEDSSSDDATRGNIRGKFFIFIYFRHLHKMWEWRNVRAFPHIILHILWTT